jgi:hypothetical protein
VLACALLLAGCGDADRGTGAQVRLPRGFNIQLFNCGDWQRSDQHVREYVLTRLRAINSGQVGAQGRGSVLSTEQATRLFDNYCRQRYATNFVLYKLYGQAAGFAGNAP